MKNNEFLQIDNSHGELFIKNFELCLDELILISFNSKYIYIPNVVTFSNKHFKFMNFLNHIINLGIDIIEVENTNTFNDMINAILFYSKNKNIIHFKSHIMPISDVYLNIDNLIKRCIFFKISNDLIVINDLYFTTSESEFHGTGIFINKKIYLIDRINFNLIKDHLLDICQD